MDHCLNSEVTELGDWQQRSVKLMDSGQLPKCWCNTTGTYVQTTQHVRHTYALGSWSAKVLQKTLSNWTWVRTKRLSEERTESAVAFRCVWMCICIGNPSIYKFKTFISIVFASLCWTNLLKKSMQLYWISHFVSVITKNQGKSYQVSMWTWKLVLQFVWWSSRIILVQTIKPSMKVYKDSRFFNYGNYNQ